MSAAKKVWKATESTIGKNAKASVSDKGILTITVDLNLDLGPSKSGNSNLIATSKGNKQIDGGNDAVIGLNVYRPMD